MTLPIDDLLARLTAGETLERAEWETAVTSTDEALKRAALRSAHLPAKWLWDALFAGSVDAWGSSLAPLMIWTQRPEWLEQAAMRAHLAMGPRLGWPDVPEAYARDLVLTERPKVRQAFGELARRRWQIEETRARPVPVSRRARREAMAQASEPIESVPQVEVRSMSRNPKHDRPGGMQVLWYEHQRAIVEPPCDEHERRALDLIATVLGAA